MVLVTVVMVGSSLLAQREQEKVSPTYADPKAGGSERLGERMKEVSVEWG